MSAIRDAQTGTVWEDLHLGGPEPDGVPGRALLRTLIPHAERLLEYAIPEMQEGSHSVLEFGRRVLSREAGPNEGEKFAEVRHHAVAAGVGLMGHGILQDEDDIIKYGSGLCALWIVRLMAVDDPEQIGSFMHEVDQALMLAEYSATLPQERPSATRVLWRAPIGRETTCEYFIVELGVSETNSAPYAFYFSDRGNLAKHKNSRWVAGDRDGVLACVPDALFEAARARVPE